MNKTVFLEMKEKLPQPLVLDIEQWNNVFITLTWEDGTQEKESIEDFLNLTNYEKKQVLEKRKNWYLLMGAKQKWWLYPEYFRLFHDENIELFSWSQEKLLEITWNRELIFIKFDFWIDISSEVSKPVRSFSDVIKWILKL